MDLLFLLGERPGEVLSHEEILRRLWPDVTVTEGVLSRTVFKLRKALGDDARAPQFIENIARRGYRFLPVPPVPAPLLASPKPLARKRRPFVSLVALGATVAVVLITLSMGTRSLRGQPEAAILTDRANDYYFQYTRPDNEAAIELFQRVITLHPDHAPAHAGLANALAQRVVRWPGAPAHPRGQFTRLADALKGGYPRTPEGRRELEQAEAMARRAVTLAPQDPASHKALGFVRSVQEDFPAALASYRQAVALDGDAWGPLINIGDLLTLSGQTETALHAFEAAFEAMTRCYPREAVRIRPWYAATALLVGDGHRELGHVSEAERWYRRTLELAPLHPDATAHLARLLDLTQRGKEAADLRAHQRARLD